jgi:predicted CXXCH cytochrome family protein
MKLGCSHKLSQAVTRSKKHLIWMLLSLVGVLVALGVVSCADMSGTQIVAPPQLPGATYVGSEACETCHEDIYKGFATATHYRLMAPGDNAKNIGCESCHGAGSLHVASGGAPRTIINPGKSPETCFQCHLDKRSQFDLPSHHPVLEGKITCSDCHDPHKGSIIANGGEGGGTDLESSNEICTRCHIAQAGPFVFEHEALREGCTTCHNPHGSVNARLLIARNQTLCLRCHYQQQTANGDIFIGDFAHVSTSPARNFLREGTCWSAGCHEAIHGSQVNPHLRY